MKNLFLIIFSLFTFHFSLFGQVPEEIATTDPGKIVGGAQIIKFKGNINTITSLRVIKESQEASVAWDTINKTLWQYDNKLPIGKRWVRTQSIQYSNGVPTYGVKDTAYKLIIDTTNRQPYICNKNGCVAVGGISYTASNGVTLSGTNITLGGVLGQSAIITTSSSNQLKFLGLQTGTSSDQVLLIDGVTGAIRKIPFASVGGGAANVGDSTQITILRTGQDSIKAVVKNESLDSAKIKNGSIAATELSRQALDTIIDITNIDSDAKKFQKKTGLNDTLVINNISRLIYNLKYFNLWDKIDALYPFVGNTAAIQRLNLRRINDGIDNTALNFSSPSPLFSTATGLDLITNSYAFARNPPDGEHYGFGVYINQATGAAKGLIAQTNGALATQTVDGFHMNPSTSFKANVGGIATATVTAPANTGLFIAQRKDNDTMQYYHSGSLLGQAYQPFKTFNTLSSSFVVLNAQNDSTYGGSTGSMQTFLILQKLTATEQAQLYSILQAFNSKLSRQVGTATEYPINSYDSYISDEYTLTIKSSASIPNMDGCHTAEKNGVLYRLGGYVSLGVLSNAIYKSTDDGVTWTFVRNADWSARHASNFEYLNGKWYLYGSDSQGSPNNEVWVSSDIENWTQLTVTSAFNGTKSLSGSTVHGGYLWRIGGINSADAILGNNDVKTTVVWKSKDGIVWDSVGNHPIGGHLKDNVVSYNGKIWTLGTGVYTGTGSVQSIYSSLDGATWVLEGNLPFLNGSYSKTWVNNNEMFILSGAQTYSHTVDAPYTTNTKQIWSSKDGINWKRHYWNYLNISHASAVWNTDNGVFINQGLTQQVVKITATKGTKIENNNSIAYSVPPSTSGFQTALTGTSSQTLRNNGTSFVANSMITNTGTAVGINTTPSNTLDINIASGDAVRVRHNATTVGFIAPPTSIGLGGATSDLGIRGEGTVYIRGSGSGGVAALTHNGVGVGINVAALNKFDLNGSAAIGSTYAGLIAAPTDGLIVDGNIGANISAPTAMLHIGAASDGGAGKGQLKLSPTPILTSAEQGVIEHNTTDNMLYFTNTNGNRRNIIQNNLGLAGGQTIIGGTASGENLTLSSTSNATKGYINLGSASRFIETSNRLHLSVVAGLAQLSNTTSTNGISADNPTGIAWKTTANDWGMVFVAQPSSGAGYGGRFHTVGETSSDYPFWVSSGSGSGTAIMTAKGNGQVTIGKPNTVNPLTLVGVQAGSTSDSMLSMLGGVLRRLSIPQVISGGLSTTSTTYNSAIAAQTEATVTFSIAGITTTSAVNVTYMGTLPPSIVIKQAEVTSGQIIVRLYNMDSTTSATPNLTLNVTPLKY